MRISKKCRHGVRIMLELAGLAGVETLTLRELARRESSSEKYLWQVMSALTAAGLITAARGSQGGYRLTRPSRTVTLKDIVLALDGPCKLAAALPAGAFGRNEEAVEHEIWTGLEKTILRYLDGASLKDLRERCEKQKREPDYAI